jgi:hypothetical protein
MEIKQVSYIRIIILIDLPSMDPCKRNTSEIMLQLVYIFTSSNIFHYLVIYFTVNLSKPLIQLNASNSFILYKAYSTNMRRKIPIHLWFIIWIFFTVNFFKSSKDRIFNEHLFRDHVWFSYKFLFSYRSDNKTAKQ